MPATITHSRVQHGVGQGSFHSASVEAQTAGRRYRFDYVYDCGALKNGQPTPELTGAIDRMDIEQRWGMDKKGVIDMLVLSHYDKDHMNCAKLLTSRFRVNRIVVPYISPEELMLVLASQADGITADMVKELHQLANGGGTLFGVAVTMVQTSVRGTGNAGGENDGPAGLPGLQPEDEADDAEWPARPLVATVGPNRQQLGDSLMDNQDVCLASNAHGPHSFWKLRFWNRGVADDLLVYLFDELVDCYFPLHALDDPTASDELTEWLEVKAHRDATVAAYGRAIARYAPPWALEAAGKKLANFLSLGLYSGPDTTEPNTHLKLNTAAWLPAADGYPQSEYCGYECYHWPYHRGNRVGWLGTGDAPLGEPTVWADFSAHYLTELPQTETVLAPHHGAAPLGGPRFYNPKLHPRSGMLAVISFGKTNTYGHPRATVLKQAIAARAKIQLVTEDTALGLHEVFVMDMY